MDEKSRDFGLFIDGLRIDRNMSREDLCEGITSLSQYKRYLRGDTSIPNDRLVLIADRLNFSISDIHTMYRSRQDKQYLQILEIYKLIVSKKFNEALKLSNDLKKQTIISNFNSMFFDYCLITAQHNLEMVSDVHVLEIYSNIIGYPKSLSSKSLNWIEIQTLVEIIVISARIENYNPAQFLYNSLTSKDFNTSAFNDRNYLPLIYSTLARIFGMMSELEKVLELTNIGMDYCTTYETSSSYSNLAMYNAYAHLELGNTNKAKESAKLAFLQLYIEKKPNKFRQFQESFEKKFNMKLEDLIKL